MVSVFNICLENVTDLSQSIPGPLAAVSCISLAQGNQAEQGPALSWVLLYRLQAQKQQQEQLRPDFVKNCQFPLRVAS